MSCANNLKWTHTCVGYMHTYPVGIHIDSVSYIVVICMEDQYRILCIIFSNEYLRVPFLTIDYDCMYIMRKTQNRYKITSVLATI